MSGIILVTPSIEDLARIILSIKPDIEDSFKDEEDDEPFIELTIGCGPTGWNYQTGDNSYSGAAYHYPYWGVGRVTRGCDCAALAAEIIEDAESQIY